MASDAEPLATTWDFVVPRNYLAIFQFVTNDGSARYNFVQLLVGGEIVNFWGIVPSWPELKRLYRRNTPVAYTLSGFSQIPGTNRTSPSDVTAVEAPPGTAGDREWLITVRGDEGKSVQMSLLVTPNEPVGGKVQGDGRLD